MLRVGAVGVWSKPLLLNEKLGIGGSLLIVWHGDGNGIYDEIVFELLLPILMWIFSQSHSASFWIYFRGNCSMYLHLE